MYSDYQNQTPIVINDRSSEGLADALASGASGSNLVRVQVPPSAPN